MADTLNNISIPSNTWVDLYDASGITLGVAMFVQNLGDDGIYLTTSLAEPNIPPDSYALLLREGELFQNEVGDSGAWAWCQNSTGLVNVNEAP